MTCPKLFCALLSLVAIVAPSCGGDRDSRDRQPTVAGGFYPADPAVLRATVQSFLKDAPQHQTKGAIVALVVPHAGYVYSGPVAGAAYAQLEKGKKYHTVFVLGPSHRVGFEGAAVYVAGDFVMPLGNVRVDRALGRKLLDHKEVFTDRTDAHEMEHSIEVQLPFLQEVFGQDLSIVPIVIGAAHAETCRRIGEVLREYVTPENLFVLSTDFSHYPKYDDAIRSDREMAAAIVTRSPETFAGTLDKLEQQGTPGLVTAMCGWTGVLTYLFASSSMPDLSFTLVKYQNSGDSPQGDHARVVGYCALVATLSAPPPFSLSAQEGDRLLKIARTAVEQEVRGEHADGPDANAMSEALRTPCGAFVTIRKRGDLRGCIGRFEATDPLHEVVREMAIAAATQDYRFPPVRADELGQLSYEISVLTPLKRIASADDFDPSRHGIYIKKGTHAGTFLPQVAKETGWTKLELLGHCAQDKAGIGWEGWRDAELYVYEALIYEEHPAP